MAHTRDDGWVWAFVAVDHFTAEAWATVAKRGDRFAATEPIYDAVRQRFGEVAPDVARRIAGSITTLELTREAGYYEAYTSALFLPHTDLMLFPSVQSWTTPSK